MKHSSCLLLGFLFFLLTQNLIGKYLLVKIQEDHQQDEDTDFAKKMHTGAWRQGFACCRALTAGCLSCAAGMTISEYCANNADVIGCEGTRDKEPRQLRNDLLNEWRNPWINNHGFRSIQGKENAQTTMRACCRAGTAECLSCVAGMEIEEYCKQNPNTRGCGGAKKTPDQPCQGPPTDQKGCRQIIRGFTFDSDSNLCKKFMEGGCSMTNNGFRKKEDCEAKCITSNVKLPPKECLSPSEKLCDELSKDEICGDRWGGVNPNYEDENDSTEDEIDYFNDYYNEDITRCPQCGCKETPEIRN